MINRSRHHLIYCSCTHKPIRESVQEGSLTLKMIFINHPVFFLEIQSRAQQAVNQASPGRTDDDDDDDDDYDDNSDGSELEDETELCDNSAIFILAAPIFSPYLKPYSLPGGSNQVRRECPLALACTVFTVFCKEGRICHNAIGEVSGPPCDTVQFISTFLRYRFQQSYNNQFWHFITGIIMIGYG